MTSPTKFRKEHGDPVTWCGAEFDEYLAVCDRSKDITERLEGAAAVDMNGAEVEIACTRGLSDDEAQAWPTRQDLASVGKPADQSGGAR
ncbi:hypothetical protein [Streptomyces sp. NPDC001410]|uniref:hypothetical protein n=1 Tax=Streptomyces sp. NPDC001410 TaxID=3364574 RepID=UPI0036AB9CAD